MLHHVYFKNADIQDIWGSWYILVCSPQPDDLEHSESRNGCSEWNRVKWDWASLTKGSLSRSLSLPLSLNEGSRVGPGLTAPSVPPHLHCPRFILSLNATDSITALIDRLPCHQPPTLPLRPRVPTEWPGHQKKRKTKFGSISVTSPHLLGNRGRINSFSLTCLPPCTRAGMASGSSKCSTDSVGGVISLSFTLAHIHVLSDTQALSLSLTARCYWQTSM